MITIRMREIIDYVIKTAPLQIRQDLEKHITATDAFEILQQLQNTTEEAHLEVRLAVLKFTIDASNEAINKCGDI